MISVIALIGAGWSLLKPFLNDREKKLLIVALPLQVLSNIAIIITDEWAPGSVSYKAWFNVLKVSVLRSKEGCDWLSRTPGLFDSLPPRSALCLPCLTAADGLVRRRHRAAADPVVHQDAA